MLIHPTKITTSNSIDDIKHKRVRVKAYALKNLNTNKLLVTALRDIEKGAGTVQVPC